MKLHVYRVMIMQFVYVNQDIINLQKKKKKKNVLTEMLSI